MVGAHALFPFLSSIHSNRNLLTDTYPWSFGRRGSKSALLPSPFGRRAGDEGLAGVSLSPDPNPLPKGEGETQRSKPQQIYDHW